MGEEALRTDEDTASGFKCIAYTAKNLHAVFVIPVMAEQCHRWVNLKIVVTHMMCFSCTGSRA